MSHDEIVNNIIPEKLRAIEQQENVRIYNEWMVDHSNRVIVAYNCEAGGIQNTIEFAKKIEVEYLIIQEVLHFSISTEESNYLRYTKELR